MSAEPFRRLVKLVARAFYDDEIPHKGANPGKSNKSDNKGISVVVLDALTRRQWVKEEELAKSLKLHPKQLRRTLRVLEDEMLVIREDRKETVKGAKAYNAAVAVTGDGQHPSENDKAKVLLHSYCCLDYAQICDVVRYRIHRARKMIKDELEDKNTVQEYVCPEPSCGRRYSALDASRLISPMDMNFHCERCDAELVAENDKLAPKEMADGDSEENARRRQREKLKEMLERMEVQLKPLMDQLAKLKDLTPPDYGSFAQWQERALASNRLADGADQKASNGDRPGVPMPFLGETKVEVALAGTETKQASKEEPGTSMKVLPPWMIREGMNLTAQQRGEAVKEEDAPSDAKPRVDVKDVKPETGQSNLQEEYYKAYYAALMQQQQQQQPAEAQPSEPTEVERQVGMKAKREDDEGDAEDELVWEDGDGTTDAAQEAPNQNEGDAEEAGGSDDEIDWE